MAPALLLVAGCGPGDEEPDLCENVTCGVNARCVEGQCACDDGFSGNAEVKCVAIPGVECVASSCGGHGACEVKNNAIVCDCDDGYAGATCAECATGFGKESGLCVANDLCAELQCTENGSCVVTQGVAACECAAGWAGELCDGCADGFVLIGNACVSRTKTVSCAAFAPAHASAIVVDVEITYDEDAQKWPTPPACAWKCVTDYVDFEDQGKCINTRLVDCVPDADIPANATSIDAQVSIHYTSADLWSDPATCAWKCPTGLRPWNGECKQEPTIESCELTTPAVTGRSDEEFVVRGNVTIAAGGEPGMIAGEACFGDDDTPGITCFDARFDSDNDDYEATLVMPAGDFRYAYRFSADEGTTWTFCGLNGVIADPDSPPVAELGVATISASPGDQLARVRAADPDASVDLEVDNVFVTAAPRLADGKTRFVVQATRTGPAVYVEIDSTPGVDVYAGDEVKFRVLSVARSDGGVVVVTGLSGLQALSEDNDMSGFVQDLSAAADLVSGLDGYESELVALSGVPTSGFDVTDDAGFLLAGFHTADQSIQLRVSPDFLAERIDENELFPDLIDTAVEHRCAIDIVGFMWRNGDVPQPTVFDRDGLTAVEEQCVAPFAIIDARPTDNRTVVVEFLTPVDPASLTDAAAQLVFEPALAVLGYELSEDGREITLTTASQWDVEYTVTASGLTDVRGYELNAKRASKAFDGHFPNQVCDGKPAVVISQVYGAGGNTGATYKNDFIELFNRGTEPVDLSGWSVQYLGATGAGNWQVTELGGTLAPGAFHLVAQAAGTGGHGAELPPADDVGTSAMAADKGKVALLNRSAALNGACPSGPAVVDLVGYGTHADVTCFRGDGGTPAPSAAKSAIRVAKCEPSLDNASDFVSGSVTPRNSEVVMECVVTCEPPQ